MPTPKKSELVEEIAERLSRCAIVIATDYRGLSVAEINLLRTRLRERQVEYRVVKNSLAHLAAEKTGKQPLDEFLEGPTALAFGYDNITEAAKVVVEYIRSERNALSVKGGLMDGQSLSADQVVALATLPPKEQLVAQVLQSMKSPMYALHHVLSSQLRSLVTVLSGRLSQLEGG